MNKLAKLLTVSLFLLLMNAGIGAKQPTDTIGESRAGSQPSPEELLEEQNESDKHKAEAKKSKKPKKDSPPFGIVVP